MNFTAITTDDGTTIPLTADPSGWTAHHDGFWVFVAAVRSEPAVTPAKARFGPIDR